MAKDFGIPILCCAQLNRGTESRTGDGKKPTLADLRDSGSIEQDADIVLFLYRDEYYKTISGTDGKDQEGASPVAPVDDSANTAEVIIAKNRHGGVGTVEMQFDKSFTRFYSIENNAGDPPPESGAKAPPADAQA